MSPHSNNSVIYVQTMICTAQYTSIIDKIYLKINILYSFSKSVLGQPIAVWCSIGSREICIHFEIFKCELMSNRVTKSEAYHILNSIFHNAVIAT